MSIHSPADNRDSFGDDAKDSGTKTIGIKDFVRLLEETRITLAMGYMKPRIPRGRPPAPELDLSGHINTTREAIKKNEEH